MSTADPWDEAIRQYDRRVYLSILAFGLTPDRAREIAQATWTRLIEQHGSGKLAQLKLPGVAIRQAYFLTHNELKRAKREVRNLAAAPTPPVPLDTEHIVGSREQIERVLAALATCSLTARRVFLLVYARPGGNMATAAKELGLSLQRVRQILCETRAYLRRTLEEVRS